MKKYSIIIFAVSFFLASCKKDNFDAPTSFIEGTVTYKGEPLGLKDQSHTLNLWQPGFGTLTALGALVRQDGTFSTRTFDGSYKLIQAVSTTQPWVYRSDTIYVDLKGKAEVTYEVTPYYMIRNAVFTKSGTSITATCKIEKIATTATLANATLYISRTSSVDRQYSEASQVKALAAIPDLNNASFTVTIPQRLIDQGYCYVRIGAKPTQSAESIYTTIQKIVF